MLGTSQKRKVSRVGSQQFVLKLKNVPFSPRQLVAKTFGTSVPSTNPPHAGPPRCAQRRSAATLGQRHVWTIRTDIQSLHQTFSGWLQTCVEGEREGHRQSSRGKFAVATKTSRGPTESSRRQYLITHNHINPRTQRCACVSAIFSI